mmetsp:Transcript_32726/g.48464  ORF Transcript_32726/g.48464 Transcript_32726/m.48464 type:complete len:92 (-) Transcript_32726:14-289(-)
MIVPLFTPELAVVYDRISTPSGPGIRVLASSSSGVSFSGGDIKCSRMCAVDEVQDAESKENADDTFQEDRFRTKTKINIIFMISFECREKR